MNHIRTYHYYWHIFFFSLLVCMTEFTKAADRDVLERVIYLAKSKGTVYTLLGKVSEQSGFLFVYDSKVVDNDRTVKLGAGQRTIRQVVYEIIGRQGYQSAYCGESYFDQSVAGAMSGCYHF